MGIERILEVCFLGVMLLSVAVGAVSLAVLLFKAAFFNKKR